MSKKEKKTIFQILLVSSNTLLSRVLGLSRDMLFYAVFGVSAYADAFIIAFTIPNLFRRLLGEGALTSALIPVLSDELEEKGKQEAFRLLNAALTRTFLALLAIITFACVILMILYSFHIGPDRWALGEKFSIMLMPYMLLICLAALIGASLNTLHRFTAASLGPVWLNLSMLFSLGVLGYYFGEGIHEKTIFLCCGVLFGGFLQMTIPAYFLFKQGWKPAFTLAKSDALNKIWLLFLPGVTGAAVLQINVFISRGLAFYLDESTVSILFLANRLTELPLGLFSIAVMTVIFPVLARKVSQNDTKGFAVAYEKGIFLILLITIPASVGLYILGEKILLLLFQQGAFTVTNVNATVSVLKIYAIGLPFYSLAGFSTKGFHALKDMKSPVKISCFVVLLNIALSLILMKPLGMNGLALANVIAAVIQSGWLLYKLHQKLQLSHGGLPLFETARMIIASGAMATSVILLSPACMQFLEEYCQGKMQLGLTIGTTIAIAVFVYFFVLKLLGSQFIKIAKKSG